MTFAQLGLSEPLLRALTTLHYTSPTPIQQAALPVALAGSDLFACAQTGTGKTASFALPILQRLGTGRSHTPRALVLTPTRELADQVCSSMASYGQNLPLRTGLLIGGASMNRQIDVLRRGVDIVVATPGRLIDHMERRSIDLSGVSVAVLDEADRMLDMGFIRDVRRIMQALPSQRQTLLFSATLSGEVMGLAKVFLRDPQRISVSTPSSATPTVQQLLHAVGNGDKRVVLMNILADTAVHQAIVFTRTKWGANKLAQFLVGQGQRAAVIHGNKSQAQRRMALESFRDGRCRVLVATDIAARGIDVAGVSHVVNFEVPNIPEDYVHRIGRTGRAGASGIAISLVSHAERAFVRDIERLLGAPIPLAPGSEPFAREAPRSGGGGRSMGGRPMGGRSGHGPRRPSSGMAAR